MTTILNNKEDFDKLTKEGLILVDFYASWCGPCKMLAPILDTLDIEVLKVDVDEFPDIARNYGIMSIPTLLLFNNGQLKSTNNGFIPKEMLEKWIEENK